MGFEIENILFWTSYWLDSFLPLINCLTFWGFSSIIIREFFDRIKNAISEKNERLYVG